MSTKIPYLDKTWNFIGGCSPDSTGCFNCWACKQACGRLKNHPLYQGLTKKGKWTGEIRLCTDIGRQDILEQPLHWEPSRIGVQFMGDLFHKDVPFEFIDKVYDKMLSCSQHTFQILTKRPDRALEYYNGVAEDQGSCGEPNPTAYAENIWFGVSAETQEWADKRIPILLQIPAAVRFVSLEPLLGEINLTQNWCDYLTGWTTEAEAVPDGHGGIEPSPVQVQTEKLDWVIIGAESKGAYPGRECKIEWIDDLVQQTKGVRDCFVKQIHRQEYIKSRKTIKNQLIKTPEEIKKFGYPQQMPDRKKKNDRYY